jgi:nucleoid DNA-binding protein
MTKLNEKNKAVRVTEAQLNEITRMTVSRMLKEEIASQKHSMEEQLQEAIDTIVFGLLDEACGKKKANLEEYGPENLFAKDSRIAANGYVNKSVNMPNPHQQSYYSGNPYLGDTDSNRMQQDIEDFNQKIKRSAHNNLMRALKAADKRPLYGKDALNNVGAQA